LVRWCAAGEASREPALTGVAVTAEFAAEFGRARGSDEDEELLLEALADAAVASERLAREPGEPAGATVLAVETTVSEGPGAGARIHLTGPLPRSRWVAAYQRLAEPTGDRPDASELAWFAVQELPDALG